MALACVALLQMIRNRPAQRWFIAVLLVVVAPLVLRGGSLRLIYLPYYLFSVLYLVLALSVSPAGGEGVTSSVP